MKKKKFNSMQTNGRSVGRSVGPRRVTHGWPKWQKRKRCAPAVPKFLPSRQTTKEPEKGKEMRKKKKKKRRMVSPAAAAAAAVSRQKKGEEKEKFATVFVCVCVCAGAVN